MSARGFGSLFMAAGVAGAALGCYLVSLNVASERAALEQVESQIVSVERDIRVLQTEIGTRGRLAQLERWNAKVIRLSAPTADQFVEGGFQLAAMVKPNARPVIEAPVIMAAAPNDPALKPRAVTSDSADAPPPSARPMADSTGEFLHTASYAKPQPRKAEATTKPVKPVVAKKSSPLKPVKTASADPLAPAATTTKDTGTAQ